MLWLAGCSAAPEYRLPDGAVYPYGPERAAVHRLSRLQFDGAGLVTGAVVFIEFCDQDGETCRGIGDVEVVLFVPGREPKSKRLNLDSTNGNNAEWNRAVRMYEVAFTIEPGIKGGETADVRAESRWKRGTKPAVMDSRQLDALPAQ